MITYIITRADGSVSYLGTGDDAAFKTASDATYDAGYMLTITPSGPGTIVFHEIPAAKVAALIEATDDNADEYAEAVA